MQNDCTDNALYGVVLVVYCRTTKRFLFLRELTDKPRVFKIKGMLAFPSETREGCDTSVRATITRLIYEEVGVELFGVIFFCLLNHLLISCTEFLYTYHGLLSVKSLQQLQNDTDVEHGIWLTKIKKSSL